jgi:hypothetical protein
LPSNGKKYQGEPLHPCNCINLFMVPRGDWRLNSKDSARGSEMTVDTDEFLKSLKSLQVSRCGCSAKNRDSDYPHESLPQIPDDALLVPARDRPEPAAPGATAFSTRGPCP